MDSSFLEDPHPISHHLRPTSHATASAIAAAASSQFQSANMHANHLLLEEPIRMASILEPSRANFFPAMTKIIGTLGPRSRSVEVICGCLKAGMSGGVAVGTIGRDFTPHVVKIKVGEDIAEKIVSFSQGGPRAVCVLAATGPASIVDIHQAGSFGSGILRYELIIASFKQIIKKQLLKRHSAESSSANGMPGGDLDTVRVLRSHGKTKNVEENGVATPSSRFPELPSGTRNNIGDQNDNLVFDQEASRPSEHMSDESMFDINDSVIEID